MAFQYSNEPHVHRHGPLGYTDYSSFKPWLRDEFDFRCVFCLSRETWNPNGSEDFSVGHVVPRSAADGSDEYENLVYACCACNRYRRNVELTTTPLVCGLSEHLYVGEGGVVEPLTPPGAKLIEWFQLNRASLVEYRVCILNALELIEGIDNPASHSLTLQILGWPTSLPDLARLRPPGGNTRPTGIDLSAFERKRRGDLAEIYPILNLDVKDGR